MVVRLTMSQPRISRGPGRGWRISRGAERMARGSESVYLEVRLGDSKKANV
jgi:hypothetical protein